jgi:ABC-2 type transport system ATP-binding protein
MIDVENLIYEYPGHRALSDISFHIPSGSITALVGPNGAGKTTLLKCLAALVHPFSGSIRINGTDILKYPRECHTFLGFLPDFFGLYDSLTVSQALTYFAWIQKMDRDRIPARVFRVASYLNLKARLNERVGSLSRGMRQRLAIGQAMIHDPLVLLLDEPASGLDPEARYALAELFLALNRQGKTLVVSSHILAELDQYATDLLILKNGRIVDNAISVSRSRPEIRRKLHISLLVMPDNIREIMKDSAEIHRVEISGDSIALEFTGDESAQHRLLKRLMESGLTIKEFYVKRQGVQEQYLETVSG